MKKLRNVLMGALFALPLLALDANASVISSENVEIGTSVAPSLTGTCLVFMNGRWYLLPC